MSTTPDTIRQNSLLQTRSSRAWHRLLVASVSLSALHALGCAEAAPAAEEPVGEAEQDLYGKSGSYWQQSPDGVTRIPVCWSFDGYDLDKQYVRSVVEGQWGASSSLRFTGWGRCDGSATGPVLTVDQADVTPHAQVGVGLLGAGPHVTLNFTYSAWNSYTPVNCECPWYDSTCAFQSAADYGYNCDHCSDNHEYCDGVIALHEFGHALGFYHEMVRPGNESGQSCSNFAQNDVDDPSDGQALTSYYDTASVMNYCTEWSHPKPTLSGGDEDGVRVAYGTKPSSLTNQVVLYANVGYGGGSQAIYPGNYDMSDLKIGNDALSAIRIPNGWMVRLYADAGYGGPYVDLTGDVADLRSIGWDDRVSSVAVAGPDRSYPVIYTNPGYTGPAQVLRPGLYNVRDLAIGNDTLSSLRVPFGWSLKVYRDADFTGFSYTYRYDNATMETYDDVASSIEVIGPSGWNPVMIFKDADFSGVGQALWPGRYDVGDLTIGNDALSSLLIPSGWRVTVIDNSKFWGAMRSYTTDQHALSDDGFNDRTSSVVVEAPAPGEQPPSPVRASFMAMHSGMNLDVYGGSTDDGAQLIQWTAAGSSNQQFDAVDVGGGYVRLVARHSGKCLSVKGASLDDGTPVVQWTCMDVDDQRFRLESPSNAYGYAKIIAKHSGKCLDVEGASTAAGARVIQWPCAGSSNQLFMPTLR